MGAVTLNVGDLPAMASYYERAFLLEPLEERESGGVRSRVLGRGATPMIRLDETPGLPAWSPRSAGLFHTAFLFESQADLAATVLRASGHPQTRFAGAADHLVSEAFYFTDPEGNGVELYWDRPRAQWTREGGEIRMATLALDPSAYLRRHLADDGAAARPTSAGSVGHVHLQVGDIPKARDFYVNALGFDIANSQIPTALFASAGGYHHHVAMNTWNSRGAGPRAASLGLGSVSIEVPGREDLDALAARLRSRSVGFEDDGASVAVADPWGTRVRVSVPGADAGTLLARA
nr:VOC family protein [Falsarthrobacter nasiphocae]